MFNNFNVPMNDLEQMGQSSDRYGSVLIWQVAIGWLVVFTMLFSGCDNSSQPSTESPVASEAPPKTLKVIFVDAPEVADEVARRWSADRNGKLIVSTIAAADYVADEYAVAKQQDVVVYPSRLLGQLSYDEQIVPLPDEVWNSSELDNRGLLRDSRTTLIRFGDKRWAVPLGSPSLRMLLRKDVLQSLGLEAPRTWEDFLQLVEKLKSSEPLDGEGNPLPTAVTFPTAGKSSAFSLLAIAAASVRHHGKLNSLFQRQSVKPLIAEPPFVEALKKLKLIDGGNNACSFEQSVRGFFQGKSAVAIGWPTSIWAGETVANEVVLDNCLVQRLPGSKQWFDFSDKAWKPMEGEPAQVDLVGFNGIQASLLTSNAHPTTAFSFLSWLGSKKVATAVFSRCPYSSPTRASHLGNTQPWTGEFLSIENSDLYADQIQAINEESVFLMFPRINEVESYLDLLSNAVNSFLSNETADAHDALNKTAQQWEELTDKVGRQIQKELLRKDFGL